MRSLPVVVATTTILIPHMNKEKPEKEGEPPECFEVCEEAKTWLPKIHPHLEQQLTTAQQQEDLASNSLFTQECAELNVHLSEWKHLFVTELYR